MLSRARTMFHKLRDSGRHSSRGDEPTPSAPATIAESKDVGPPPRAIHYTDRERSSTNSPPKRYSQGPTIYIIIGNAKGASDSSQFYNLLCHEKGGGYDPTHCNDTTYYCGSYRYYVYFCPAFENYTAMMAIMQHICFIFTYDASSKESWDEMVAAHKRMRSRCKDGAFPFLATMIAAMGESETAVSHAEAEAFAIQQNCLFVKYSPTTGRGICDAVGSLVERAYVAGDQYPMGQKGQTRRDNRAMEISEVFSGLGPLACDPYNREM